MSSCPPPESLAGSPNSGRTLGSPARGSVTVGRWLHVPVPRPKGDSASGLHGHYVLAGLWGRAVALVVDTRCLGIQRAVPSPHHGSRGSDLQPPLWRRSLY